MQLLLRLLREQLRNAANNAKAKLGFVTELLSQSSLSVVTFGKIGSNGGNFNWQIMCEQASRSAKFWQYWRKSRFSVLPPSLLNHFFLQQKVNGAAATFAAKGVLPEDNGSLQISMVFSQRT